jgi:type VI secretion system protein ImpJ
MSLTSKPVWSEGLLLRPQHFQQYDRYLAHSLEGRVAGLRANCWGVRNMALQTGAFGLGQVGLAALTAVLPDGTVLEMPDHQALPPARVVPPNAKNILLKISAALQFGDGPVLSSEGSRRRLSLAEQFVHDNTAPDKPTVMLKVGAVQTALLFEGEPEDDLVTMPIARIREVDATGKVLLDTSYIPPCLDAHASPRLLQLMSEVRALLRSRAEALASRGDPGRAGTESASLLDLLVLTVANGQEAVFDHLASLPGVHPEEVFAAMVRLAGELSTFTQARRRAADFPAYRHLDLDAALAPIVEQLRQQLAVVIERNAIQLPLQERGYGIRTSTISDRTLFQDSQFVMVASAAIPSETLRGQLPVAMKIGSIEQIRDLVNLQLPGVPMRALPVAPRDLPFLQNACYFELDQSVELWRNLLRSAAFAFHVSGEFPELRLEFWAIRGKRT